MTYPEAHNYLTVHWDPGGGTNERGQFGLRFASASLPDQAMVDGAAAAVQTWWTAATSLIGAMHLLSFLRLARIGTNGQYVPGTISYDHIYAPAVAGGGVTVNQWPLQTATCMTLRTGVSNGLAHSGRVYTPPLQKALLAGYLWPIADVTSAVNTFSAMLSSLDGSALGELSIYSKGNAAFPTGAVRPVTQVQADNRPDVQRRRASQLHGTYSALFNVT